MKRCVRSFRGVLLAQFAACVVWSSSAHALTLQDVIRDTLKNNPDIQAARQEMRSRRHEIRGAKAGYLPTLDAEAGVGREWTRSPSTGNQSVTLTREEAALRLRQVVYDGSATHSEVERQRARYKSALYSAIDTQENAALRASQAYINVLREAELLSLLKESLDEHQNIFDQMQLRNEAGVGSRVDVDQISVRLSLATSNFIAGKNNFLDALSQFQGQVVAQRGDLIFAGDTVVTADGSSVFIDVDRDGVAGSDGVVTIGSSESARFDNILFDRVASLIPNSSQENPINVGTRPPADIVRQFKEALPNAGIQTAAEGSETQTAANESASDKVIDDDNSNAGDNEPNDNSTPGDANNSQLAGDITPDASSEDNNDGGTSGDGNDNGQGETQLAGTNNNDDAGNDLPLDGNLEDAFPPAAAGSETGSAGPSQNSNDGSNPTGSNGEQGETQVAGTTGGNNSGEPETGNNPLLGGNLEDASQTASSNNEQGNTGTGQNDNNPNPNGSDGQGKGEGRYLDQVITIQVPITLY